MHLPTRKKKRSKILSLFAVVLALAIVLAACGNGETGGNGTGGGGARDGGTGGGAGLAGVAATDYVYVPSFIDLPEITDRVSSAVVHGDRIFYYYIERDMPDRDADIDWETWEPAPPNIIVASMTAEGGDKQRVVIPATGDHVNVPGFHITAEGNLALIIENHEWDMQTGSSVTMSYAEYDFQGNRIVYEELDIVPPGGGWFQVERAFFLADGGLLLTAWTDRGSVLISMDAQRTVQGQIQVDSGSQILAQLADGRLMMMDWEREGDSFYSVLREIDLEVTDFGETFRLTMSNVRALFPSREGSPFDLYIDDGTHLFGYDLATGERTLLLNWIESGLAADWDYHVSFLGDGRISILSSNWEGGRDGGRDGGWSTEMILLTRTPRAEVPPREIITLGGFGLWGEVRAQIVSFNRLSQTHQIQVRDYSIYSTPDNWRAGLDRFQMDLITGLGPDIIWGHTSNFANLIDRGILADLYTFIDADPELNRSDFFQSILEASEASDGTLPMLSASFGLQTMIGRAEQLGHIDSWTLAEMLTLLEEADLVNTPHIMGQWMTGENFLFSALMFSGPEFIDWGTHRANLDSEEFIHLLEIAARLPNDFAQNDGMLIGDGFVGGQYVSAIGLMLRGEQLLEMTHLWSPQRYQEFSAAFDDMLVLGVPTSGGGTHVINPGQGFGINAASNQRDAAWSFVRHFLSPEVRVEWDFPLRIDQYEAMIAEAMAPALDMDGNEVDGPRATHWVDDILSIDIYPMTAAEAAGLRAIIESANLLSRFDETVMEMMQEELLPFFAGDRSAADTARILQNRIQTLLNEQR